MRSKTSLDEVGKPSVNRRTLSLLKLGAAILASAIAIPCILGLAIQLGS